MRSLRKRVKDAVVAVRNSSPIPGLGVAGGYKLIVEDRGGRGLGNLQRQTDDLVATMKRDPGLATASSEFRSHTPQLFLDIDRTKAEAMGLSFDDVNQTLGMYLGSLYVNSFNQFGRHWQVTVQLEGDYRNRAEDINLLQVRNKWGEMVPLGTLVNVREVGGPITVTRYNLYTASSITGGLAAGVSSGNTIKDIDRLTDETLPLSMKAEWTEVMFLQIRAGNTAIYIFALSVVSVFLALAALYESWALPLAVILVVPMCLLCSLVGVLSTGRDVNIFVQIGLVVLVGLACKNAILIVEYAKQKHVEGLSRARGDPGGVPAAAAADPDDVTRLHHRRDPAGRGLRRRGRDAAVAGDCGLQRHGGRDVVRDFPHPGLLLRHSGVSEKSLFASAAVRWVGSALVSGLAGSGMGFLFAGSRGLGIDRMYLPIGIGGAAGILAALLALGIHQRIREHSLAARPTHSPHLTLGAPKGDLKR